MTRDETLDNFKLLGINLTPFLLLSLDCNSDSGCSDGLKCWMREFGDPKTIPGCKGEALGDFDYCYDPTELDIVEIAMTTPGFSSLADLVAEANLLETLKGNGPFTVFAPTNAAFEALPKETIEALVLDNDALTNVLLYHVVSGEILSSDLVDGDSVMTVQGSDVVVSLDTVAMINDAKIITADIFASNGVIHIIDSVLIPPS